MDVPELWSTPCCSQYYLRDFKFNKPKMKISCFQATDLNAYTYTIYVYVYCRDFPFL